MPSALDADSFASATTLSGSALSGDELVKHNLLADRAWFEKEPPGIGPGSRILLKKLPLTDQLIMRCRVILAEHTPDPTSMGTKFKMRGENAT